MSKEPNSPAVVVVDTAFPSEDFSLLQTPTQAKHQRMVPGPSPYRIGHNPIVDPDHYVFKLKYEDADSFLELVISHLTRFLDLPGPDLETMRASAKSEIKPCSSKGVKKPWGFMKKKEVKGAIFGVALTDETLVQIQNLTDFLSSHLEVEGLFRKPGNAHRLLQLRAALNTGVCIDLETSKFHSHDVASILKTYLGELPEPLLQHKYFKAHLQIAGMMSFDIQGNVTNLPDKAKRVEALQLLLLLLPTVNRTLLRGILNLLYQTAKNQKSNKMNASNLATMFCPHLLWPRNLKTLDLQNNIGKLNEHVAFMIRHSQKIFVAPQYIRDSARAKCTGSSSADPPYPSVIFTPSGAVKRTSSGRNEYAMETRSYTEKALKELFQQVNDMPNSAKKKKIVKNMEKQSVTPGKKRHKRSRTFGGMIKKKVLSVATPNNNKGDSDGTSKEKVESFVHISQPGSGTLFRSRPVLSRRKSASSKKSDKGLKDSFFRRSLKVERKGSRSSDVIDDPSKAAPMSPIPFPCLDDGNATDKENENKTDTSCQKCL